MPIASGTICISEMKRCYVNIQIETLCPNCKKSLTADLSKQYLSYPKVGDIKSIYLCCDNCETDWDMDAKIFNAILTIQYDPKKLRKD
jgi:hypothetical protein